MESKEKALQGVDKKLEISEISLTRYNDGYREGFSDGYDSALKKAREIAEKYNLGGEKKELRPAVKFLGGSIGDQLEKVHTEYIEAVSAYMDNEGRDRVAEEIVDVQEACETALAILGLSENERRMMRLKVIGKNSVRGYYLPKCPVCD